MENALKEADELKNNALSLTTALLTGRYGDLTKRLENALRNEEVDRDSKQDIEKLLNTMGDFYQVIRATTEYLDLEPKVLKLLPADKTLRDTPDQPPQYTPTTFVPSPFGSSFITPAFNSSQFSFFPFAMGGGASQNVNQDLDVKALIASFGRKYEQESMQVDKALHLTFRTTGTNKNAKSKHSAISIKLPNQQMQDAAYELIVNHRTAGKGSVVRIHDPIQGYTSLGTLPSSMGFRDTIFNISSWAQAIRHAPSDTSVVATYLSFVGDPSDIHSFTIKSGERTLKEVIFGNDASEKQSGIHVYAPETDQDANDWSEVKEDEVQQ